MRVSATGSLVLCAFLSISTGLAQGPGFGPGRGRGMGRMGGPGAERVVTGAPFSAVEVRTFEERLADGNTLSRTSQITRYRDSQGRTRTEETIQADPASGKQARTRIVISDVVAGERHELDSTAMTVHTTKIRTGGANGAARTGTRANRTPGATPAVRTGRDGSTMTRTELGTQVVNGVAATGRQEVEVIPAGKMGNAQPMTTTRTVWTSTELKMPVQIKTVDPRRGTTDVELTNIAQAEPDATLFVVPAGYTVKSPGARGAKR